MLGLSRLSELLEVKFDLSQKTHKINVSDEWEQVEEEAFRVESDSDEDFY